MRSRLHRGVRIAAAGGVTTASWMAVLGAAAATALALAAVEPIMATQAPILSERQIKAAFIYNFTKYVEWPAQRFASDDAPLVIGVFGRSPFGAELQEIAQTRKVGGRDVVVKQIETAEEATAVHVVFFGAADDDHVAEMLAALRNVPVLTVGESAKFAAAGGMITFVRKTDQVRFEIAADSVERAGLKISSQLLKLAKPGLKQP